jgi:hypothetical protein
VRGQNITIRPETAADHDAIRHVNQEAFDLTPCRCTSGNERITRKTEVADDFPIQVVCDWIGNTEPVASKYYLQVTEEIRPNRTGTSDIDTKISLRPGGRNRLKVARAKLTFPGIRR